MMTQLDIFSQLQEQDQFIPQQIERKRLTPRQYRLHDLIHNHSMRFSSKLSHKDILERMDEDYGYTRELLDNPDRDFNNLVARRELSDDLDAVVRFMDFQVVYIGGRYATNKTERDLYLLREEIAARKVWHKLYIQKKKAKLEGQQIIQFTGYEKEEWDSWLKQAEDKVKELEREVKGNA
jgi:hypothetical protein